ncbi:S41 family peptidase [Chitinophaga horti]|uniref:S41 family peptidase n=1 Tax=Chitinophaga horti TaxID=2920382 RepID=A0ABY6J4G6_9BACT|nr:S41 family peptidase [Chitinophaga horti]UYQ94566.1 S41 family peptidase [Chitinophaga horti]
MKRLTCLFLLLSATATYAQQSIPFTPEMKIGALLFNRDFKEAAALADETRATKTTVSDGDLVVYARAYAANADTVKALACLHQAIDKGFWKINDVTKTEINDFLKGPRLDSALDKIRERTRPYRDGTAILDKSEKELITNMVRRNLQQMYVDSVAGKLMADEIGQLADTGFLSRISNAKVFIDTLSEFLRKRSNDKHFNVGINGDVNEHTSKDVPWTLNDRNFGFSQAAVWPGNIGYIRWDEHVMFGYEAARYALNFLRHTRAIVIDLRQNGGGAIIANSYFYYHLFEPGDKRPHDMMWQKGRHDRKWRRASNSITVSNVKLSLTDKPIYVLTSGKTMSAAEQFAFTLKELKRATIIGENTAGAGNLVRPWFEGYYVMMVPVSRFATKKGKTVEGVGVAPDIPLPATSSDAEVLAAVTADLDNRTRSSARR